MLDSVAIIDTWFFCRPTRRAGLERPTDLSGQPAPSCAESQGRYAHSWASHRRATFATASENPAICWSTPASPPSDLPRSLHFFCCPASYRECSLEPARAGVVDAASRNPCNFHRFLAASSRAAAKSRHRCRAGDVVGHIRIPPSTADCPCGAQAKGFALLERS